MAAKKARKSSKPAAKKAAPRPVKGPREGSAAPDFDLPTDGTGRISLKALRGSLVVVYFYPRDDTPGCTKEACGFNDALPDFSKLKAEIVGVSKDKEASHARFRGKYGLKFQLAADTELKAAKAYGVWIEKSLYGRKYMGMDRATFLIDKDGVIRRVWRGVKVPGHVDEVLAAAQSL
ncbi:MAG: peroxiredoxin [Alphaproteobacteria bacterium]|nr:peroxiredoxin [Alphaproteobacteria bacterium]